MQPCDDRPQMVPVDNALSVLFSRHDLPLVRLAACLTGERDSTEDVVQDAFVSLQRHRATLRDSSPAEAYLRRAVINGSRSQVRRLVRERVRRRPALVPEASSEDRPGENDEHARVFDAVQRLPQRQR